jgi:hypothetical protein
MTEKCIGAPGCYTPPYLEKLKNNSKSLKNHFFFEIKDEYRYCTYKNISLGKLLLFYPG